MRIIHLSDTHFGNNKPAFDLQKLQKALNDYSELFASPDTYMVVSGDITFQGNPAGYDQAHDFFKNTWLNHNGGRERFLACPGNHDICGASFKYFDSFLHSIRRDNKANFSKKSHSLICFEDVAFLLINSAVDLDHKYGWIDCESLHTFLESENDNLSKIQHRIAVVHHHLIGSQKKDISTIRNSLPFIALLDKFNFNLILHGHQHSQGYLSVGENNIKIFSARSLNYPTPSLVNGINLFSYDRDKWNLKTMILSGDNSVIHDLSFS